MKISLTPCLLVIVAICAAACSSDSSETQTVSDKKAPVAEQAQPKPRTGGITIAAFLRGSAPDEAAAKAFEQGMTLAAEAKSPPAVNRTLLNRNQGGPDDPSLQPLLTSGSIPLVVYWQTNDLAPSASALKQADVIAVPVWNVTKKVAALGTNVFGFGFSTEGSFAQLAKFAGKELKSYRFGVIAAPSEPFATQSKAFIEETKSLGNTVVFDEKADSAAADFEGLVTRAKKESCDTIFAVLPGDSLVALIKAARTGAFVGKILVGDSFFAAERAALGKDADGIYILQAWSDDAAFRAQYSTKYGGEPDGITLGAAALGYDLIRCIEAVGENPDSGAISYAWLSNPCEGLTGKTQFTGERMAQRQKRILTVKSERFELAG